MADDPTTTDPGTEPATTEPGKDPEPKGTTDQKVPYERFQEVNERLKAQEAENVELKKWREEQEAAKLTEIERVQKAASEAQQRAEAAEARAQTIERGGWVVDAARKAGFADPQDAALAVKLDEVEDQAAAEKAVEKLKGEKPHWLKGEGQPTAFGTLAGAPSKEPPVGPDGKPDEKAGLGQELMAGLFGGKK